MNTIKEIKLQQMKLKIIDELQRDGNLKQWATGKPRNEITYEWKDFMRAWSRFPEDHQNFTWTDLVIFYNDFHQEINEHHGNK